MSALPNAVIDDSHDERLREVLDVVRVAWAHEYHVEHMRLYWFALATELALIVELSRQPRLTKRGMDLLTRARDQRVLFGSAVAAWLSACPDERCLTPAERRIRTHLRVVGRPHEWRHLPEPD